MTQPPPSGPGRILINFFTRFAGRIVSMVISIIVMGMLGRYLGEAGYGEYAFWYGLIFFLQPFNDVGLDLIMVREIARDRSSVSIYLGDSFLLKAVLSTLFLAVVAVAALWIVPEASLPFLLIVALAAVIGPSQDISIWIFRGIEIMEYEALLTVFSQLVWITSIYLFITGKCGILHMLAAQLAANVLRTSLGLTLVFIKGIRPIFRFDLERYRRIMKASVPVGITFILSIASGYANIALLKWLGRPEDIAAYNVGLTLTAGFLFLAITLTTSFYPIFSRYVQERDERLPSFYAQASKYMVIVAAPISVGLIFLSDRIIALVFHQGFETSILSLKILSLTLILRFFNRMYRFIFPASDRQNSNFLHEVAALLSNVVLSLLLIPRYQFLGACISFVASETLLFWLNYRFMSRIIAPLPFLQVFLRPILASLAMGLVLHLLRDTHIFFILTAALVTYPVSLLLVGAFSLKEVDFLRGLARPRRSPAAAHGDIDCG